MSAPELAARRPLPEDVTGTAAPGWWGMVLLIATEATIFVCLIASYFYLLASTPTWPPAGIDPPRLVRPVIMTIILLVSSGPMIWAHLAIGRGHQWALKLALALTLILGAVFLALQATEYLNDLRDFTPQSNNYGSLFYTILTVHSIHVLLGLGMIAVLEVRAWLGHFSERRRLAIQNVGLYWHFVDVLWVILIFPTLYLAPHYL